jgi:hypothetical protein
MRRAIGRMLDAKTAIVTGASLRIAQDFVSEIDRGDRIVIIEMMVAIGMIFLD